MDKNFNVKTLACLSAAEQIDIVLNRILEAGIDITGDYKQWRNICFGFTLVMGEAGRDKFHQLSHFHPRYDYKECDDLYSDCMKRLQTGGKEGVTIASFFKYAKDCGISVGMKNAPITPVGQMGQKGQSEDVARCVAAVDPWQMDMPTFSDKVLTKLHGIFQEIADQGCTVQQKDMLICAAIVLLSGCFPQVWAKYDNRLVFCNLFFFLVAPPASNKGIVSACLKVMSLIEQETRDRNEQEAEEYRQQMAEWKACKNKDGIPIPKEPPYRSNLISANSSSTAIYQALSDNNGEGITFETEADSMAYSLKSDYGNFSDGLRKAFHHERISYTRRTDKEHVCINSPKWSVLLTGTPGQVPNLIPSCEDGLFSRFCFLIVKREGAWRNVFQKKESTIDETMEAVGKRIYEIHRLLVRAGKEGVEFRLTEEQQDRFNDFFSKLYAEYGNLMGEDFDASVLRQGLSCFRIAMVLSIVRLDGATTLPEEIVCQDDDFDAALVISDTLTQHAAHVFSNLMATKETEKCANANLTELQKKLYEALPDKFTRQQAMALAPKVNMVAKTINKYIGYFVSRFHICKRVRQGEYEKTASESKSTQSSTDACTAH